MIVRELLTRLGFLVDNTGARKYENELARVRRVSLGVKAGIGLVTAAAGFMINRFAQAADKIVDYRSRVKLAIGENGDLEGTMSRLFNLAQDTYSSFDQTTESFLRNNEVLKELGHTADDTLSYTASLNDSLVISGIKGEDAAVVMQNLQRAMQMGVLRGDQFNAVMQRGGRVAELLRRKYGATTEELREMASKGLISMPEFFEMMIESQEENRRLAADMPQTFADARQNLQTEVLKTVDVINQATGATALMAAGIDNVRFSIRKWTPHLISAIEYVNQMAAQMGGWSDILETVGYGLAGLASLAVLTNLRTLVRILGTLGTRLTALLLPSAPIIIGITIAGMAIDDFMMWLEGKDSVFGQLFGDIDEHTEAVEKMSQAWTQFLAGDLPTALATAGEAFDAWATRAKPHVADALHEFNVEFHREVDRLLAEDWQNIQNIFWDTILFFKQRWTAFQNWFGTIWANTTAALGEAWQGTVDGVVAAWGLVENAVGSGIDIIKEKWTGFTGLLSSGFQLAIDTLKRIWGDFKTWWEENTLSLPEWLGGGGGMTRVPGGNVYNPNDYPDLPGYNPQTQTTPPLFPSSFLGGTIDDAGRITNAGYRPPPGGIGSRTGSRTSNVNVDMTGMAFNVNVPPGTTRDQSRAIYEEVQNQITAALDRAVRSTMDEYPDAEEAIA